MAKADIAQCLDAAGTVTYTNVPCENSSDGTQDSALSSPPVAKTKLASASENFAGASADNEGVWTKKRISTRTVTLDVETMKAARSSMLARDEASHVVHRHELIALDKRNRNWFDFR
jgi:hypothetical protein